jgi:hypothetical protein
MTARTAAGSNQVIRKFATKKGNAEILNSKRF